MSIVVVIPTLNEEETIDIVIDGVKNALVDNDCQILVVDGHSTDRTVELALSRGVTVISQESFGYGDALLCGFRHAVRYMHAQLIAMLDGDNSYDPKELPRLLQPILEHKTDFVIGNRFADLKEGSITFTNKIGNRFLSWVIKVALKTRVKDTQCGFRAFDARLLSRMDLNVAGMPFATEMLIEAKHARARILEVPVTYNRRAGKTKLHPIRDGVMILATSLRLTRDYEPLVFFGSLGFILIFAGILLGLRAVTEWLMVRNITHLASVVLTGLLIMSGIQLLSLGLVADMIRKLRKRLMAE